MRRAATAQSSSRASGPWTLDDGGWIRLWFRFGVLVVGCLPVPIVQVIQVVVVGDGAVAASRRSTIGPAGGAQPGPPGGGTGFPVPMNRALLTPTPAVRPAARWPLGEMRPSFVRARAVAAVDNVNDHLRLPGQSPRGTRSVTISAELGLGLAS